jgi:hypothetical protein
MARARPTIEELKTAVAAVLQTTSRSTLTLSCKLPMGSSSFLSTASGASEEAGRFVARLANVHGLDKRSAWSLRSIAFSPMAPIFESRRTPSRSMK